MNKMKSKSIICLLLLGMMFGMFSTSCQDMLSPDSERHSYTVAEDTLYSYWGILKSLQNIAERYVILNECRGDLVDENSSFVSDTIGAIVNFGEVKDPEKWKDGACAYLRISDYYHIINSCNAYIAECDLERTTGTSQKYMVKEYAQVQAIRAWVYMQLLYAYGENRVPFYTEPMLTTDNINNFIADKNHTLLNAQILAEKLGPELESVEPVEVKMNDPQYQDMYQGMPGYNNYGDVDPKNSHFVCHSSKCMFPVPIVLGDLYLLSGDYAKAARHYYYYISSDVCGPLPVSKYYSTGLVDVSQPNHIYYYDEINIPYNETEAVSRGTESITCIPSNKGKLEGKVMTDINRLFGFEAQLRTSNTEGAGASVGLSMNYERELIPSRGYEALCDSQKYEMYVGTMAGPATFDWNTCELKELALDGRPVGDARRAWIYDTGGEQFTFRVGEDRLFGKMVTKQNPDRRFSTVYPLIYRKSTVWLRFAEALNRAGFPGYAFAILKSGLCSHPNWVPKDPKAEFETENGAPRLLTSAYDYPVKAGDSLLCYLDDVTGKYVPSDWATTNKLKTTQALTQWFRDNMATEEQSALTDEALFEAIKNKVYWRPVSAESFENQPSEDCHKACYYISLSERQRAANAEFLNLNNLTGQDYAQLIYVKEQGTEQVPRRNAVTYSDSEYPTARYTIGVHQRGCGFIVFDDPKHCRSTYNYVDQVGKRLKENNELAKSATEADVKKYIYNDANLSAVEDAVEDLIIDEMGLELAFEGTRFSDLYRAAQRRGANYLAERVAKRHTGEVDESLRIRLNDKTNWFLPIPEN